MHLLFPCLLTLCIHIFLHTTGTCHAASVQLTISGPLHTHQLLHWQITEAAAEWLTFDVHATPRLRLQDGKQTFLRHAYLREDEHGQQQLRVTHAPRSAGLLHWELLAPTDESILASGTHTIKQSTAHIDRLGPIHISPHNARLLATADGSPFIPIGPNICWATGETPLLSMQHFLNQLADNGGNHCRIWLSSWFAQLYGSRAGMWRLHHAELLAQVLASARSRQIKVTLVLDNHHDVKHGDYFPFGETKRERIATFFKEPHTLWKQRNNYLFARFGADDTILAWEVFNEMDEALKNQKKCEQWLQAAVAYLQSINTDNRLITSSLSQNTWHEVVAPPLADLVQVHAYIPSLGRTEQRHQNGVMLLSEHRSRLETINRPFCFSEVGFNGSNEQNPGNDADTTGILLRHQAWAGLLLGGYGTGMSWWWDTYIEPNNLWQIYQPIRTACDSFDWTDPQLEPLRPDARNNPTVYGWQSPRQAMLWPHLHENTWHRQLRQEQPAQHYPATSILLSGFLPDTNFLIRWINIETGVWHHQTNTTSHSSGRFFLDLPENSGESVALIRAE